MRVNHLFYFYIIFILYIQSSISQSSVQPNHLDNFPIDYAYISQSTSCANIGLITWTCPPCSETFQAFELVDYYEYNGLSQYILYDRLRSNMIVTYRYSYSIATKYNTICINNPQTTILVSSEDEECNTPVVMYISHILSEILLVNIGTDTLLDILYQRIRTTQLIYPRINLAFTGYELSGSVSQVVNNYYMVKTYKQVTLVSLTGCIPENKVILITFNSPLSTNYVHDQLDGLYGSSNLYTPSYYNNYWWTYNCVNCIPYIL